VQANLIVARLRLPTQHMWELGMATCFICGARIPNGHDVRRRVYTGTSVGGFNLSSSVALNWLLNSVLAKRRMGVRSYYSVRTICHGCSTSLDKVERRKAAIIFILVAIAMLGVGIWLIGLSGR
jgi:predicted nucleic acid-binding Zn ribbon protein